MERLPFQVTRAAAAYENIKTLPVAILLDNVRSMYNVGAFFRTADAAGVEKLYLCGITSHPPKKAIGKTALGAEDRVPWEHAWDALAPIETLRARGYELAAVRPRARRGFIRLEATLSRLPDFRARSGWHPAGDRGALGYACAYSDAGNQAFAERGDGGRGGGL